MCEKCVIQRKIRRTYSTGVSGTFLKLRWEGRGKREEGESDEREDSEGERLYAQHSVLSWFDREK
jgi:hypothetical protein